MSFRRASTAWAGYFGGKRRRLVVRPLPRQCVGRMLHIRPLHAFLACVGLCLASCGGWAAPDSEAALDRVAARLFDAVKPVSASVRWEAKLSAELATATAYSYADGRIVLSRLLLEVAWRDRADDPLLAGVLAHEMGHVQLGHHLRAAEAAGEGYQGIAWQTFRRELEYEADTYACSILTRAGYAPRSLMDALARLMASGSVAHEERPMAEWALLDHPTLVERYNHLQGHMQQATEIGKLFNFALLALRSGRPALAQRCFERLAQDRFLPSSAEVRHNLGLCEHLRFLHAATPQALGNLRPSLCPLLLLERATKALPNRAHLEAAARHYRRALELAPDYSLTKSHLAVALAYLDDGSAQRTAEDASRMTAAGPAEFNNLGFVLHRGDQCDAAILAYDEACARARPYHVYDSAVFNRAFAYESVGRSERAAEDWALFLQRSPRGRWVDIAKGRLEELKAREMDKEAAGVWVAARYPTPPRMDRLTPPRRIELWQSAAEVIALLGSPNEIQRFPEQEAKLLRYTQPAVTLLFDRDVLVAVETDGALAEEWLEDQGASMSDGPERAVRGVLGPPDMRRTERDGSCWLGYGSIGLILYIKQRPDGTPGLELCSFIPPTDAFVQG